MASLERRSEGLCLVDPLVDDLACSAVKALHLESPSHRYSVTLVTKQELDALHPRQTAQIQNAELNATIFSAGVGKDCSSGSHFLVIIWAYGQQIRKSVGLPPRDFYISLSERDVCTSDGRNLDSLLPGQFPSMPSADFLDHLALTLQLRGKNEESISFSVHLAQLTAQSVKGFIRLADAALLLGRQKLAMLSFACAFQRVDATQDSRNVRQYCIKKICSATSNSELGTVLQEHEVRELPSEMSDILLGPWPDDLRNAISDQSIASTFGLESRQPLFVPTPVELSQPLPATCLTLSKSLLLPHHTSLYMLPRFFRWIIPYCLAVMSTPRHADDIAVLATSLGIRHVLTLTEEEPLKAEWFNSRIKNTFLPIPNRRPPSIEQMDLIISLFQSAENLPLLVHCGGGKGRAGTVVASYLAAYGFNTPENAPSIAQPAMSARDAIAAVRSMRPGSLETREQENFVSQWVSVLWKRRSVIPGPGPAEPSPTPFEVIEGCLDLTKDNFYILVGNPGSGKSSFSSALRARDSLGWEVISHDKTRDKNICVSAVGRDPDKGSLGRRRRVIIDRCNSSRDARREWYSLASNWVKGAVCIWFDYSPEICIARAQLRPDHPTLPPGSRVRNAVSQTLKTFQVPSLREEKYFRAIVRVQSFSASDELVRFLSPSTSSGLFKYPRTPHLINLGAVGEDDIVTSRNSLVVSPSSSAKLLEGQHIVITEKVDGANLGFSLSPDKQILVQNRSHYVNSSSHAQFKQLDLWIEAHREDLYAILDRENKYFTERFILFGEWTYATHSIAYTQLPDRFMAFDIYDRSTQTWADRRSLIMLLRGTSISPVHVVYEGSTLPSDEELIKMTQGKSLFYDGKLEGIYVYIERGGKVFQRGKVVRGDFISGNEHWKKGKFRINGLMHAGESNNMS